MTNHQRKVRHTTKWNDDIDNNTNNTNDDQITNIDNSQELSINTSDNDEKYTEQCSHEPAINEDNTTTGLQNKRRNYNILEDNITTLKDTFTLLKDALKNNYPKNKKCRINKLYR